MVSTVPITKNTFASNVKAGLMTKQFVFHYSHSPLKKWYLALYIYFVRWSGCFTREISLEVAIPYPRYYKFIRTVIEKLASSLSILSAYATKLDGQLESDEFYIKAGLKGRSYHDKTIKSVKITTQKKRTKAMERQTDNGTFDKDQPMINCIHQRNGLTYLMFRSKCHLLKLSAIEYSTVWFHSRSLA